MKIAVDINGVLFSVIDKFIEYFNNRHKTSYNKRDVTNWEFYHDWNISEQEFFELFYKAYDNIMEIPISVTPFLRLPLSWLWFRNLGLNYAKICTILNNQPFTNIYFHPWEFQDIKKYNIPLIIKRNTGNKMKKMLKEYLRWCLSKNFNFVTMDELVEKESAVLPPEKIQ